VSNRCAHRHFPRPTCHPVRSILRSYVQSFAVGVSDKFCEFYNPVQCRSRTTSQNLAGVTVKFLIKGAFLDFMEDDLRKQSQQIKISFLMLMVSCCCKCYECNLALNVCVV
jgi:hypothetical protein